MRDVLNPQGAYEPPGTRSEPMVMQATLHDEEVTQHRLPARVAGRALALGAGEHQTGRDLGGAEKHYAKFPREFQRLQERYEAAQAVP